MRGSEDVCGLEKREGAFVRPQRHPLKYSSSVKPTCCGHMEPSRDKKQHDPYSSLIFPRNLPKEGRH